MLKQFISIRIPFGKFKKILLVTIGVMFLGLGMIGYVLPGLPGTICLIIAATLFVRSSDRLYNFIINNRLFGRPVGEFLRTGAIPLRAKVTSVSCMWTFSIISLFLTPYSWLFDVPVLLLATIGTIYIISRRGAKTSG